MLRVAFDLLPQLADIDAQIFDVFRMAGTPDMGEGPLVGDDLPGMFAEIQQKVEFPPRQCAADFRACRPETSATASAGSKSSR